MKNNTPHYLLLGSMVITLSACALFKKKPLEYAIDPVCNMKVIQSESYQFKYENKKYYFDSYECKQSFVMNPKTFLENKCATPK